MTVATNLTVCSVLLALYKAMIKILSDFNYRVVVNPNASLPSGVRYDMICCNDVEKVFKNNQPSKIAHLALTDKKNIYKVPKLLL